MCYGTCLYEDEHGQCTHRGPYYTFPCYEEPPEEGPDVGDDPSWDLD